MADEPEVLVVRFSQEVLHNWLHPFSVCSLLGISSGVQRHLWMIYVSDDERLNTVLDGGVGFGRVGISRVRRGKVLLRLLAA